MSTKEVAITFKDKVLELESDIRANADGVSLIAGTEDKPIVNDSSVIPIEHQFTDGVYVRKMTMYKGTAVIGAIHKHLHVCFLTEGSVTVTTGQDTIDYIAPCTIVATPGVKRVLYANEDSVWYNIHQNPTNTQNVGDIERYIVAASYEEYDNYIKNK